MTEKILVTGAAGFIGYHTCEVLLRMEYQVIGLDNLDPYYDVNLKRSRLDLLGISKSIFLENNKLYKSSLHGANFQFIKADISDRKAMPKLFEKGQFNKVCHLAAQAGVRYSLENPEVYVDSNVVGFLNILEGCRHTHVEHLVYASSSSVYGDSNEVPFSEEDRVDHPVSLYAATKKSNELMAHTYSHLYKLPTTGLRFFTVYGPWGRPDMAMFLFTEAILKSEPVNVFNEGQLERDFTYIDDIVAGVMKVIESDHKGSAVPYSLYNIGNGQPIKLLDFIEAIEGVLDKKALKNMMPMQPGDVTATWANVQKLKQDYGYAPNTPIDVGVKNFIDWYRDYYKQ
ncbi:NAD-dependent epimerase [Lentiprolixibacter aurantiacus]|uniref:NAD-dependent epimerase n=1 Tax=Lentiprolixibacter aurantiacus TaxID=2993939 RepID=A0AAE3MMY9_9FLAO|nr:NAD-dependent epimerase [Lentiprolixibacter aurantiacus]MCX2719844.1 NAD-dependent epimerase [Lentiprolixibacter aurantiacus]